MDQLPEPMLAIGQEVTMTTTKMLASDWMQTPQVAQSGALRLPCSHAPYGHRSAPTGAPDTGLTGQRRENGLGWYLLGNGHRCYSPVLMRFHSSDLTNSPWSGGGVNSYAYCQGDPVNSHDRSGRIKNMTTSFVNSPAYQWGSTLLNDIVGAMPMVTGPLVAVAAKLYTQGLSKTDIISFSGTAAGAVIYAAGRVAQASGEEHIGALVKDTGVALMGGFTAYGTIETIKSLRRDHYLEAGKDVVDAASSSLLSTPNASNNSTFHGSSNPSTPASQQVKFFGGRPIKIDSQPSAPGLRGKNSSTAFIFPTPASSARDILRLDDVS
ncbi:RHS repeat-associated core domain-containing protein [Pseudomonas sp. WC1]|uniref:RHS repeat-associated core domain-containing protein n=1 Tax=Pseudomonas sp. WC1 TaxID=3424772 RepID=UPI003D3346D7